MYMNKDSDRTFSGAQERVENATKALDLVEQHLEFKRQLVDALHEYGRDQGYCSEFDQLLMQADLPPRQSYIDNRYVSADRAPQLAGEDTTEAFEQWKAKLTTFVHDQADHRGVGDAFDDLLEQVGLARRSPWVTCQVQIEGTFKFPMAVRMREGGNVVDRIDQRELMYALRSVWHTDDVQWKATMDGAPLPES